MTDDTSKQGWYKFDNARKWHYFKGSTTSLCGRYMAWALDPAGLEDTNHNSADNCAACKRKREELAKREQEGK